MAKIIIFEDDPDLSRNLLESLTEAGHEVEVVETVEECLKGKSIDGCDVLIIECELRNKPEKLPWLSTGDDGISSRSFLKYFLPNISGRARHPEVVAVTKFGFSAENRFAVESGCVDYISLDMTDTGIVKVQSEKTIAKIIQSVAHAVDLKKMLHLSEFDSSSVVAKSRQMKICLVNIAKVVRSEISVALVGEEGVGKKFFAKKIHENSSRNKGPFIVFHCSHSSSSELQNDLFGQNDKIGAFEKANGGTLFLNNVDKLPENIQEKISEAMGQGWFNRVDSDDKLHNNFRLIISVTEPGEKSGKVLNYGVLNRLGSVRITLPPLHERGEDIPGIVRQIITEIAPHKKISQDVMSVFHKYNWPGNISEVKHVIKEMSVEVGESDEFNIIHLPVNLKLLATCSRQTDIPSINILEIFSKISTEAIDINGTDSHRKNRPQEDTSPGKPKISFYRSDDIWMIGPQGKESRFKHSVGCERIHFLLQHPKVNYSAEVVSNIGKTLDDANGQPQYDIKNDGLFTQYGTKSTTRTKLNDPEAIKNIAERLEELKKNIADQSYGSIDDREKMEEEIEKIEKYFSKNIRQIFEDSKARTTVSKGIKAALDKIATINSDPRVSNFLNKSTIRTGNSCVYCPLPGEEPEWILEQPK